MIYGIILVILYVLVTAYSMWTGRTPVDAESEMSKLVHYIAYACAQIINLSILGYLIYALTCL